MKGFRFYAELPGDRGSKAATKRCHPFNRAYLSDLAKAELHNNVIAVPIDDDGRPLWQGSSPSFDAVGAVRDAFNSPVCGASTNREYLRSRCVRVSESLARKLHPALFSYLEG